MKIGVRILPKNEVLDSQGRAVQATLQAHGYRTDHVRIGKYVHLDLPDTDERAALAEATRIANFVLVNPLIETFELEVVRP